MTHTTVTEPSPKSDPTSSRVALPPVIARDDVLEHSNGSVESYREGGLRVGARYATTGRVTPGTTTADCPPTSTPTTTGPPGPGGTENARDVCGAPIRTPGTGTPFQVTREASRSPPRLAPVSVAVAPPTVLVTRTPSESPLGSSDKDRDSTSGGWYLFAVNVRNIS